MFIDFCYFSDGHQFEKVPVVLNLAVKSSVLADRRHRCTPAPLCGLELCAQWLGSAVRWYGWDNAGKAWAQNLAQVSPRSILEAWAVPVRAAFPSSVPFCLSFCLIIFSQQDSRASMQSHQGPLSWTDSPKAQLHWFLFPRGKVSRIPPQSLRCAQHHAPCFGAGCVSLAVCCSGEIEVLALCGCRPPAGFLLLFEKEVRTLNSGKGNTSQVEIKLIPYFWPNNCGAP